MVLWLLALCSGIIPEGVQGHKELEIWLVTCKKTALLTVLYLSSPMTSFSEEATGNENLSLKTVEDLWRKVGWEPDLGQISSSASYKVGRDLKGITVGLDAPGKSGCKKLPCERKAGKLVTPCRKSREGDEGAYLDAGPSCTGGGLWTNQNQESHGKSWFQGPLHGGCAGAFFIEVYLVGVSA